MLGALIMCDATIKPGITTEIKKPLPPQAKGVPGLGKDMTNSAFIDSQSDAELVEFIKLGRTADDPLNTTGVAMPAKGANVALSDEDILLIVEYMRTLSN